MMTSLLQRLKLAPISLTRFNLLLALWFCLALNWDFFAKIHHLTPYQGFKSWVFVAVTAIVLVGYFNFVLQLLSWKWTAKPVAAFLVFLGGLAAYTVNSLGVVITPDQIQNLVQTDRREAVDSLSRDFWIYMTFLVIIPWVVIAVVKIRSDSIQGTLLKKVINLALSLLVVGGLLFIYYVDFASIFRGNRELKGMISPHNFVSSGMSYYRKKAPKKDMPLQKYGEDAVLNANKAHLPKLMVLVVGETARAESFALNGYAKNTNPYLSKQDIVNFSQVSSCGTSTAVSVPCMFSGMPREDYDADLASHREGLLDIAQRAGYKVTWIDNNSGCKGVCTRTGQFEIPETLQKKWCEGIDCYDEILIDAMNQYLSSIPKNDNTPQLIVLHQLGSHGPAYYKRAPKPFQHFKPTCDTNAIQGCSPQALINTYDNTIVYTDYVLSKVIDTIKTQNRYQTAMWYLSDHGESTGEHGLYLHGAPYAVAPSQQTHIPMVMWFSPTWKQQSAAQVRCIAGQKTAQLSQDNLFPSLLSLLDIQTQTKVSELDMLQNCPS